MTKATHLNELNDEVEVRLVLLKFVQPVNTAVGSLSEAGACKNCVAILSCGNFGSAGCPFSECENSLDDVRVVDRLEDFHLAHQVLHLRGKHACYVKEPE